MTKRPTITLEHLLTTRASRLPLLEALYIGLEVARRVDNRHRVGLGVGAIDVDRVLLDERGIVSLGSTARGPLDVKKDVFALGHVLYELLTGTSVGEVRAGQVRTPGARLPAPSAFNPAIDAELDAVVLASLSLDEALRPPSVAVVTMAIEAVFDELEIPADAGGLPADIVAALPNDRVTTLPELPVAAVVESILSGQAPARGLGATPPPLPSAPKVLALPPPPPREALAEAGPVVAQVLKRSAPAPVAPPPAAPPVAPPAKATSAVARAAAKPVPQRPAAKAQPQRRPPAAWYVVDAEHDEVVELDEEPLFDEDEARPPENSGAWAFAAAAFSMVAIAWSMLPM